MGRLADAQVLFERSLEIAREIGDLSGIGLALTNLAVSSAQLGAFAAARELAERGIESGRASSQRVVQANGLMTLAELDESQGDVTTAEARLDAACDHHAGIAERNLPAHALVARGAFLVRRGRAPEARRDFDEAIAVAQRQSRSAEQLLALAHLAAMPGGDAGAAQSALAVDGHRVPVLCRMEARFLLWRATADRDNLVEARRLLDHLVAHAPPECRESMLSNVVLHRQIAEAAKEAGVA
jgi:tetratricopeptide (TPR) repeat protein